jgi:hypothetical protein
VAGASVAGASVAGASVAGACVAGACVAGASVAAGAQAANNRDARATKLTTDHNRDFFFILSPLACFDMIFNRLNNWGTKIDLSVTLTSFET